MFFCYANRAQSGNPTLSAAVTRCCGLLHWLKCVCIYILRCNTYILCMYECVRETHLHTHTLRGGDRQWKKALHISWNAIWWGVKWDFASALHRWSHCWPVAVDLTLHLHVHICFLLDGVGVIYTHSALWCTSFIFLSVYSALIFITFFLPFLFKSKPVDGFQLLKEKKKYKSKCLFLDV